MAPDRGEDDLTRYGRIVALIFGPVFFAILLMTFIMDTFDPLVMIDPVVFGMLLTGVLTVFGFGVSIDLVKRWRGK